ncbi:hypothetical protein [Rhizobium sp. BR 249]|uniref:hypothetical protein n=1 Tax=Rhizobium sp. BR 249 TaxID=3040011 RepID=UPI0039BF451D
MSGISRRDLESGAPPFDDGAVVVLSLTQPFWNRHWPRWRNAKMPSTLATWLRLQIILVLILCFPGMAAAMAPCRDNTLAKAKVVVAARVKSLAIGDPGLLLPKDYPKRVIRVDLEIEKVIKGTFIGKEATLYGIAYPPSERLLELLIMSLATGTGGQDTFEWELSANKIDDDMSFYSLNNCNYSKFPIDISRWQQP